MAAFNFVEQIAECPVCGVKAQISIQVHVASEFGDFHHKTYGVGDIMPWFDQNDPRYMGWYFNATCANVKDGIAVEYTSAKCEHCSSKLFAAVKFRDRKIEEVFRIGEQHKWPNDRHSFIMRVSDFYDPKFRTGSDGKC